MPVILAVASDAGHRSFAERDLRPVTAVAMNPRMRAFQMKVGELVIKTVAAEVHNVGLSPVVFAMAALALPGTRAQHAAVIAAACSHVGGDAFVAVEAQGRLT